MDARIIISLFLFIGISALLRWLLIDAIWKANDPAQLRSSSQENEFSTNKEAERNRHAFLNLLALLKPDKTG